MIRSREEDAQEMEEGGDDEEVGAPVVDVPDEPAEGDVFVNSQDGAVGFFGSRFVREEKHHSRQGKKEHEDHARAPEPPCE